MMIPMTSSRYNFSRRETREEHGNNGNIDIAIIHLETSINHGRRGDLSTRNQQLLIKFYRYLPEVLPLRTFRQFNHQFHCIRNFGDVLRKLYEFHKFFS